MPAGRAAAAPGTSSSVQGWADRGCWQGQCQAGGTSTGVSWAVPPGWEKHRCAPAACPPQGNAWQLALYHSSSFQHFQMWDIFQTELHRGENPAFSTACGCRLSIKALAPPHQPPAQSRAVWSWSHLSRPKVTGIHPSASLCLRRWL